MQSKFVNDRREAAEMYWELLNASPQMRRSLQNLNTYLRNYEAGKVNPLQQTTALPNLNETKKTKLPF